MKIKTKLGAACAIGGTLTVIALAARAQTPVAGWLPMQVLHIQQPGQFALPIGAFELKSNENNTRVYERTVNVKTKVKVDNQFQNIPLREDQKVTVGPTQINKSLAMIVSAADLLKAEGFNPPLIERVDGKLTARIHPGNFPCDEDTGCNISENTFGVYRGTSETGGKNVTKGKLFLSEDWASAGTAVVPHELFHGVVASYDGFNAKQSSPKDCPTACWLSEGLAEGYAKYWADKKGASHGYNNTPYLRYRTYDLPLATGSGEEDYDDGLATGRFWNFVAKMGGSYKPIKAVLGQGAIVGQDNGVKAVDAGLKSSLGKSLGDVYGEFVRRELSPLSVKDNPDEDSAKDYTIRGVIKVDAEKSERSETEFTTNSRPPLAAMPFRVEIKADKIEWPNLRIVRAKAVPELKLYYNRREVKDEIVLKTRDLKKIGEDQYELYITAANTTLPTSNRIGSMVIEIELFRDKCDLLPAPEIATMVYKQDSPTVEGTINYKFGVRKQVGDYMVFPASGRVNARDKTRKISTNTAISGIWKCGPAGASMDGLLAGAVQGLNGNMKENGKVETISNTLYFPSKPKVGDKLASGQTTMRISTTAGSMVDFVTTVSNRQVVAQETLTIVGIGPVKCWKITGDLSFAGKIGPANKGMEDQLLKQLKKNGMFQTPEGKRMLADPDFRRTLMNTAGSLMSSISNESGGKQTVWFKRGLGLVKTVKQGTKPGDTSTLKLQSVTYRTDAVAAVTKK